MTIDEAIKILREMAEYGVYDGQETVYEKGVEACAFAADFLARAQEIDPK